jgi:hypothetical protein
MGETPGHHLKELIDAGSLNSFHLSGQRQQLVDL